MSVVVFVSEMDFVLVTAEFISQLKELETKFIGITFHCSSKYVFSKIFV